MSERNNRVDRPSAGDIKRQKEEEYPGVKVEINDPSNLIFNRPDLRHPVSELTQNCIDQGAKEIRVEIEPGRLTIEDDVHHSDAESLARKLNQGKVKSTKPPHPEYGFPLGGCGILASRMIIGEMDGEVTYRAKNGKIITEARWNK